MAYRLKRPWPDGRTDLVLAPVAFLRRLAGIIPPPRHHLVRYAGVFAPRARLRARVVALAPRARARAGPARAASIGGAVDPDASAAPRPWSRQRPGRLRWADLLRRVFAHDVLACPCGGRRRVLCFITDRTVVGAILIAVGLATTDESFAAARAPPIAKTGFERPWWSRRRKALRGRYPLCFAWPAPRIAPPAGRTTRPTLQSLARPTQAG